MVFNRIELLLYSVLAAYCASVCHGQLEKPDAATLATLQDAWVNTEAQPFYKMEKNDVETIELVGGDEVSTVSSDTAEFVFRQAVGEVDAGFFGTVSTNKNDINIVFDVLMQDEGVFVKIKEGVPDDSKDIWFSVKDEGLADLSKDITNSLRVSEVGENLEEDHVRGIVELNQALAGEPEGVTCYEITPTEQFKASKASEPKFEIAYTSTYCMDTEKNLLTRLTFNLTETAPSELDSGEPGQLDVEASTDIKFSDFGVKVDFPKLDLSKFAAENKVGEGTGADGAPGAPGGSEDGKKDKESDVDLSGEPGEPGDNSAFRNDRFAFIFVGLSMLAFM